MQIPVLKITKDTFKVLRNSSGDTRRNINSPVYFSGEVPTSRGHRVPEENVSIKKAIELLKGERSPVVVSFDEGHYWGFCSTQGKYSAGAEWLQTVMQGKAATKKRMEQEAEEVVHVSQGDPASMMPKKKRAKKAQ